MVLLHASALPFALSLIVLAAAPAQAEPEPGPVVDLLVGLADDWPDLSDADGDGLPHTVDDPLCNSHAVENAVNGGAGLLGHCGSAPPYEYTPPTVDRDGDGIPDNGEAALCGRAIVEDTLAAGPEQAGRCDGGPGYGYTPAGDGDLLPDGLESDLCAAEDRTTPVDGSCAGEDYAAPAGPDADGDRMPDGQEWLVCMAEDPGTADDGWCDAGGADYVTPTGQG